MSIPLGQYHLASAPGTGPRDRRSGRKGSGMRGGGERWLGPGETARRFGVSIKALRVYEREHLVEPHRAESGWRLFGPAQLARLHQIIVLRDLGLPLKAIGKLLGARSGLREVLALQRESLEAQHTKISRALDLIAAAERRLDQGDDLSVDDLATLTRGTVVQPSIPMSEFRDRLEALIAERDPSGQTRLAIAKLKDDLRSANLVDALGAELQQIVAEAGRLRANGDVESDAAIELARRWRAFLASVPRPPDRDRKVIRGAYEAAITEAEARPALPPFDPATLEFLKDLMKRTTDRGS